ncbi:hypothetical protein BBJ28_00006283 [Nothophytophthora sp. Chile5]|nr:hypothetical protein BBJ28_00006283 [Nothophytophthora sp. Chile5]
MAAENAESEPPAQRWRDLQQLYVHRDTLRCALTRCIACCYKIVLHGRPGLLPNVRPEMCPRMATPPIDDGAKAEAAAVYTPQHRIGLYDAASVKRILTVGDGNFSYSLALARALGPDSGVQLVATSHESKDSVVETYPDGESILSELHAMPHVTVHHEVDATDAAQMQALGTFDRVIWNFPCVRAPRGEDGQNQEMEMNKQLLHGFFAHVAKELTATGEVHVTHKTKAPFGQWGIEAIAASNALRHQQSIIFDRCLYPGYSNKKVLSKGSFPIWDSQTFVFVPESRAQHAAAVEAEDSATSEGKQDDLLVPVTMELLKKFYLLLTPSLDDTLYGRKKKKGKSFSKDSGKKRKQSAVSGGHSKPNKQSNSGKKKQRRS